MSQGAVPQRSLTLSSQVFETIQNEKSTHDLKCSQRKASLEIRFSKEKVIMRSSGGVT